MSQSSLPAPPSTPLLTGLYQPSVADFPSWQLGEVPSPVPLVRQDAMLPNACESEVAAGQSHSTTGLSTPPPTVGVKKRKTAAVDKKTSTELMPPPSAPIKLREEEERECAAADVGVAGRDQRAVGDREGHFRHPTEVCAGLRSHRHLTYYVGQLERGPKTVSFSFYFCQQLSGVVLLV